MKKVRVFVAGKINLSLNILGREQNLHLIDSVMASVTLGDFVTAQARQDNQVNIRFENAAAIDPQNNTVKKTVDFVRGQLGGFGVDITVEKHIPVAAGLGGSSADIAGTLVALDILFGFAKGSFDINLAAAKLGSDVPFMLRGGCARVTGTGEIITPAPNKLDLYMVVANGKTGVGSGDAYRRFDTLTPSFVQTDSDNARLLRLLADGDRAAIQLFGNALTAAADSLAGGGVSAAQNLLMQAGAIRAVMTGSGSAVVGYFSDLAAAQAAAKSISSSGSGFWAQASTLAPCGVEIIN